ncbi:MbtH family NRPS accessory protein [Paracoccus caeni]|uniref:MbtH family NRPS accessory protein n=1 Tax=Paracoccus caeni TaxID=657651 RepID=A0A934SII3_9RHOB|nr:MbtH family NRPS accessory protein [Paracoccus caeni]MBK4215977.1 MbtH family NRPS accessory protein [Paracoccus caeni]
MSDDISDYIVTISEDGRHAIWPGFRPLPWGWRAEGYRGSREACLAHIAVIWTEMRPTQTATGAPA